MDYLLLHLFPKSWCQCYLISSNLCFIPVFVLLVLYNHQSAFFASLYIIIQLLYWYRSTIDSSLLVVKIRDLVEPWHCSILVLSCCADLIMPLFHCPKYLNIHWYLHAILYHCNCAVFVNFVRARKNLTATKSILKTTHKKKTEFLMITRYKGSLPI